MKIPTQFFIDIEMTILNFIQKKKKPSRTKMILDNKTSFGGIIICGFMFFYTAIVLKTAYQWYRNTQVCQMK